jgi:glucose-6-phosphate 1-epimerase
MAWELLQIVQTSDERTRVILQLMPDDGMRSMFPHDFVLTYTVVVGASLEAELSVYNPGPKEFMCTEALHTYCLVGDVEKALVVGLQNAAYVDKAREMRHFIQLEQELVFKGREDRVYMGAPSKVSVEDPALSRVLKIEKAGGKDMVVWNPHAKLAATIADMGEGEWKRLVCVEAANTGENPVKVPALATHLISTRLTPVQNSPSPVRLHQGFGVTGEGGGG